MRRKSLWKERELLNQRLWTVRGNVRIPVAEMPNKHLRSTINMLEQRGIPGQNSLVGEWIAVMEDELNKRRYNK